MISPADPKYRLKMKMNKEIENLYKISQLAGDSYEIWWIINNGDYIKLYRETMNNYPSFFIANTNAHFLTVMIRIHMLNDPNEKAFSFHKIINLINESNDFGIDRRKSFDEKYDEFKQIWEKVMILRHNRFGHYSSQMSYSEAFKKANITPNQMKKCISLSFLLLNIVSDYLDLSPKYFVNYISKDTISLLDTLKNS